MTRNVTFIIVLVMLIVTCFLIIFGNMTFITEHFETVKELKEASAQYTQTIDSLDKAVSQDMPNKKRILSSTIEQYESTKAEYERVVAQYTTLNAAQVLENDLSKDIYDVDFLWTIVGNYATEEGVNLKFDVTKNTTSPESYANNSNDYVVCDLKFSVTGSYIHLTDFIYDIEDDDRLNFEINDFNMKVNESELKTDNEPLNATFVVYSIKLNSNNLIENYVVLNYDNPENNQNSDTTNTSASTSTNTTKTTNSPNTSSTNTTSTTKATN